MNAHDISRPHPKAIWRSKWWVGTVDEENVLQGIYQRHHTYKKPATDKIKGKLAKKFAKRQKIKAMKAAA